MFLAPPSADLQVVYSEKYSKLKQSGSFSALQTEEEILLFLEGLDLTVHKPTAKITNLSKFVIGIKPVGFNFYTIDTVVGNSFIGYKIQTHLQYILSAASICYLRGYLAAIVHNQLKGIQQ